MADVRSAMMVLRAAEDWSRVSMLITESSSVDHRLTPMLIKAMITRIESENMIELSGIGVPMVVT